MQELHILVSVLDLDNAIVGLDDHRTPTRARPITPIISLNDVKDAPSASCVPTGRERTKRCFLIVLVYGGAYRIRTDDILLAKQALYQLS